MIVQASHFGQLTSYIHIDYSMNTIKLFLATLGILGLQSLQRLC